MPTPVTLAELNRTTLARQGLLARSDDDVPQVVGRVGGLQAQHADMPYVALWSRRAGQTIADLEGALTGRTVVKATVMRSTLHLVPADAWAVLDAVSAEQRLAAWRPSARRAGVDLGELNAAVREYAATPRTLDEIEAFAAERHPGVHAAAAIPGGVSRPWWRLAGAGGGLVHVPPSGLWGSHPAPRYVDGGVWLAAQVAPLDPATSPDELRAGAVHRYLAAFGPASAPDVARGLGIRGAGALKSALAALDLRALEAPDGRVLLDLADAEVVPADAPAPVRFLARWDHLLVALAVRDRLLDDGYAATVFRRNADVLPTMLVDGRVAATWARERDGASATLRITTFEDADDLAPAVRAEAEDEADRLLAYLEPDATERAVAWSRHG